MQSLGDTQPSQVRTCRLTKPRVEPQVSVGGAGKMHLDSEGSGAAVRWGRTALWCLPSTS